MRIEEAFNIYASHIACGEQGIFWCVRDDLVSNKERWVFGIGETQEVDFDTGPFPFFSITDWQGENQRNVHFAKWYSSKDPPTESVVTYDFDIEDDIVNSIKQIVGDNSSQHFIEAVTVLQKKQRMGDCWVANLAERFFTSHSIATSKLYKSLCALYRNFLQLKKRHCGGVVILEGIQFASFSPEVFIVVDGNVIRTCPIKGTGNREYLKASEKERSELMMVTDLLRNDLGMICERVLVEQERILTQEQGFWHARAIISGTLSGGPLSQKDFQHLLPAGSISGAPKKRVVELICLLESFERKLFTGTFGVVFSPNDAVWNILIRTLFADKKTLSFPVGAGITILSNPNAEWEELLTKRNILKSCVTGAFRTG